MSERLSRTALGNRARHPAFLQAHGFRVLEQASVGDLHARFLAPAGLQNEPLANYEHLVLAQPA